MTAIRVLALVIVLALTGCSRNESSVPARTGDARPSILLITLDTTRADFIGEHTPAFNALSSKGRRFDRAYATAPQTLPSHASMMTGLLPAAHGVHENARHLDSRHEVVAERLQRAGYRTAAFVSAYPLARTFGLARGFQTYDDELPEGHSERTAKETTDRAIAWLNAESDAPRFLWVHYFEPHSPYEPPEPFRSRFPEEPYRAEIAAMDDQMGRLIHAFRQSTPGSEAIVAAGDHGEGLGDHGESQHGNLLYESVMHVPLSIAGPDVPPGVQAAPVSTRRIFHTILDFAGLDEENSLLGEASEVVLGEAMVPYLQYGWQPQVMAVDGNLKVIQAGAIEVYDVAADPRETNDLAVDAALSRPLRQALTDYPIPSIRGATGDTRISDEEQKQLASLGYVSSDTRPVVRQDAPRPRDMAHLFDELDAASGLFVGEEYARAIVLLEKILAADPYNLMAALRIAAAHSALGENGKALAAFRRAEAIAPESPDVYRYLALHYARTSEWERAVPMLERVVSETPDNLPVVEALASLRERQGRLQDALGLRQRALTLATPTPARLVQVGQLAMSVGATGVSLESYEKARAIQGPGFRNDLELGVLYLASRRFSDARAALDRVPRSHPEYPMALFKRAQVSVLLNEPDRAARIEAARQAADGTTRELIANERLFR